MNDEKQKIREMFMPIAVVEHHQMLNPLLDTYDICDRLGNVWHQLLVEAEASAITLSAGCIIAINGRVAKSLDSEPGLFRKEDSWPEFVESCGEVGEESHAFPWLLSDLYWNRLTKFRLATAWLYMNALRVQNGLAAHSIKLERLGPFLESLSGSGPPIFDGQTFYPSDYEG